MAFAAARLNRPDEFRAKTVSGRTIMFRETTGLKTSDITPTLTI